MNSKVEFRRIPPPKRKGFMQSSARLRRGVGCSIMRIPFEMVSFFCFCFKNWSASIIAHTAHQIEKFTTVPDLRPGERRFWQAMAKAGEADLDLVKISPNAVPVCKLMLDYSVDILPEADQKSRTRRQEKPADHRDQRSAYVPGNRRQ